MTLKKICLGTWREGAVLHLGGGHVYLQADMGRIMILVFT